VVRLTTEITDPDAIQKIIDGRLVSVSSGHSSKLMTCNLCGNQLLDAFARYFGMEEEGSCDHIPGKVYKDDDYKGLCFGITGPLTYHEVSFVNMPAQSPARKVDWELLKMADASEGPIIIPSMHRGKKSDIASMVLMDGRYELDLLTDERTRVDNVVSVSMSVADKVISSVLDGVSPEDDAAHNAEPEQVTTRDRGSDANSRPGGASDANSKSRSDSGDAVDGRSKSSSTSDGRGEDSNGRLSEAKHGVNMTDNKNELSTDALQASIESLTQDKATLTGTLEEKATEIETLVLLKKPGTEKLDEKEAKDLFVDELAKRSVESLRDSLADLAEEYVLFCDSDEAPVEPRLGDSVDGVDVSGDRLVTPALADADGDNKVSTRTESASDLVDQALGI